MTLLGERSGRELEPCGNAWPRRMIVQDRTPFIGYPAKVNMGRLEEMYADAQDVVIELELSDVTFYVVTSVDHSIAIYIGFQGMPHEVVIHNFGFVSVLFDGEPLAQFYSVKDFLNSWLWHKFLTFHAPIV